MFALHGSGSKEGTTTIFNREATAGESGSTNNTNKLSRTKKEGSLPGQRIPLSVVS